MTIVLHELCTNAAKYGALSNDDGKVEISWSISGNTGERVLELVWQEANGPQVTPPTQRGFGTRVIERTLAREHDADVSLDYRPSGVRCGISVPLH